MKRIEVAQRPDWQSKVEQDGLLWHTIAGTPYWDEKVYYQFNSEQIEQIEKATETVHELFCDVGDYIVQNRLLGHFNIPLYAHEAVYDSWRNEPPALNYGRFDFGYDGVNPPKLFEYNCDTPTSLLEAAIVQWNWKEEVFPSADQFNSIHERLVERWQEIRGSFAEPYVHFAYAVDDVGEDILNVAYLRDTAEQAGLDTIPILMEDIGFDHGEGEFVDLNGVEMETIFKLYPWEWLVREEIGPQILKADDESLWIEPMWKMIWSNKAILPFLWQIAPEHENLLGASFTKPETGNYVKKPILAREGANIEVVKDFMTVEKTGGSYEEGACVYQDLYSIPKFAEGAYPVIGSWCVNGYAAGMGIREDGLITGNAARFVPHIIAD